MRAATYLASGGPLDAALAKAFEPRPSQLQMAEMVETVLTHDGVALIEAGTGTGKTCAYLVPAALSGRRVVVSTGTRALQDQIMAKDLPLVERVLGRPVSAACLKGLGNYLCRRRYHELVTASGLDEGRAALQRRLPMLQEWVEATEAGDRAELADLGDPDPLWEAVQSGTDTRIGPRCRFHAECFVTEARQAAADAQIVVVNHHLFFADLAVRGQGGSGVLPGYEAVVFDEAHLLEDIATRFFGVSVSDARVRALVADADRTLFAAGIRDGGADRELRSILRSAEALFASLPRGAEGSRRPFDDPTTVEEPYLALDASLESLGARAARAASSEAVAQIARRAEALRGDLARILDDPQHSHVAWVETRGRSVAVGASPVDVSGLFHDEVLARVPSLVLTSATLTVGGSFAYVRQRLGIDFEVDEAELPSSFDFAAQAALYLPELPDPRDDAFVAAAAVEIERLVALTGGGAFVLCTSRKRMRQLAKLYRGASPAWTQGDAPQATLLDRFREHGSAVLFATGSFWAGVDVPGDALRLVIVDRVPFDVPTDPLVAARSARLEDEGRSAFTDYLLPGAALTLKQGFGRLIRSRGDRGIVAVLDSRIRTKGYGRTLLESLPGARRVFAFGEAEAFWRSPDSSG